MDLFAIIRYSSHILELEATSSLRVSETVINCNISLSLFLYIIVLCLSLISSFTVILFVSNERGKRLLNISPISGSFVLSWSSSLYLTG